MTDIGEEAALKALNRLYQENESGLKWLAQMEQQHPVLPSQEQLTKWDADYFDGGENFDVMMIKAFQAGADKELDACCEWIYKLMDRGLEWSMDLRLSRRPKPPSLKEQALKSLKDLGDACDSEGFCLANDINTIRRALESLPD